MLRVLLAATAALILAGCVSTGAAAQTEAAAPLAAPGPAEPLAQSDDDSLQWSAGVVRVDFAPNQTDLTVKLFGLAGGDPAMNGLYTYIAFLGDPHEAWRIYRIGDFLDYRILSAEPGRVDVEIRESTMNPATNEFGARTRRIVVAWTAGEDRLPTNVTAAPAR